MKTPAARSARFSLPLAAVPIAAVLAVLLFVQGRLGVLSIAVQIVPLSIFFGLTTASSKYICRAMPSRRGSLKRLAAVHLPAAAMTAAVWVGAAVLLGWILSAVTAGTLPGIGEPGELAVVLAVGIVAYLWSVTACYLTMAVEDAVRAENRAVESQCSALDAELKALRAKLHPHFLFNSLNSIAALCAVDADRARDMCIYLSDFLRHSLSFSSLQEINLLEELALVRAYLNVERIRFSDKMSVREHIAADIDDVRVPPLLLQPLAENAVKHGVAGMEADGWIDLRIERDGEMLVIRIANPVDPNAPKTRGTGHGLAIVRERLRNLFGDRARVTVTEAQELAPVFIVELLLPVAKELSS